MLLTDLSPYRRSDHPRDGLRKDLVFTRRYRALEADHHAALLHIEDVDLHLAAVYRGAHRPGDRELRSAALSDDASTSYNIAWRAAFDVDARRVVLKAAGVFDAHHLQRRIQPDLLREVILEQGREGATRRARRLKRRDQHRRRSGKRHSRQRERPEGDGKQAQDRRKARLHGFPA